MSPQVKVTRSRDFEEALAHLPAPPAPSLLYESQLAAPSSSLYMNTVPSSSSFSLLNDDDYNSFYNAIPTTADAPYTPATSTLSPTFTLSSGIYSTSSTTSSSSYAAPWQPEAAFSSTSLLLGSSTRTLTELVNISNLKLNNDIFSTRSLSIHRRILVKNLLTLLYETHPTLDWIDDESSLVGGGPAIDEGGFLVAGAEGPGQAGEPLLGEDEQNGWIEQTLSAAGLAEADDDDDAAETARVAHETHNMHSKPEPEPESVSDCNDDIEHGSVHITTWRRATVSTTGVSWPAVTLTSCTRRFRVRA
jgi:hypothetical protein